MSDQAPTDYQADQLRRLQDHMRNYGQPLVVVCRVGVPESDVPPVWTQLAELGLVKVTRSSERVSVSPVAAEDRP